LDRSISLKCQILDGAGELDDSGAEIVLEKSDSGAFTLFKLARWVGGTSNRQFALPQQALKSGEVIRIHRRLYCLGPKYHRRNPDPLGENQRVHGPNCISLENALSIFLNFPIWFY